MSKLEIPDAAFATGWNACTTGSDRDELLVTRIITAAAPIIVAAKLRKKADDYEITRDGYATQLPRRVLTTVIEDLRKEAEELDPPEVTP